MDRKVTVLTTLPTFPILRLLKQLFQGSQKNYPSLYNSSEKNSPKILPWLRWIQMWKLVCPEFRNLLLQFRKYFAQLLKTCNYTILPDKVFPKGSSGHLKCSFGTPAKKKLIETQKTVAQLQNKYPKYAKSFRHFFCYFSPGECNFDRPTVVF